MADHPAERRRAPRTPASGRVEILIEDPVPAIVEAELIETSVRGFRVSHHSNQLFPGLEVRLRRDGGVLPARVVWSHILNGRTISGCMLL